MDFDAVVVAGGAGRRLGGVDKAALDVGGVALLDRVLLAAAAARRTVVVGPRRTLAAEITWPVGWTQEQPAGGGPVAALDAGMAALEPPALPVLVLATDLPQLTAADVQRLVAALAAAGEQSDGAVFVDQDQRAQPLAAIYRHAVLVRALAREQPVSGRPMRAILTGLRLVAVPDRGAARDCDTPEALRRARAAATKTQD